MWCVLAPTQFLFYCVVNVGASIHTTKLRLHNKLPGFNPAGLKGVGDVYALTKRNWPDSSGLVVEVKPVGENKIDLTLQ